MTTKAAVSAVCDDVDNTIVAVAVEQSSLDYLTRTNKPDLKLAFFNVYMK
jgi:hypothetical protein